MPAGVSGCIPQYNGSTQYDCLARGLPPGATPVYVSVNGTQLSPNRIVLPPVTAAGEVAFPYGQAPNSGGATFVVSAGGVTVTFLANWPCHPIPVC